MPHLNEVQRRVVDGSMARALGRGGKTAVAEAAGEGRNTVVKAIDEVGAGISPSERLRAEGAGDKLAIGSSPGCSRRWTSWCTSGWIAPGVSGQWGRSLLILEVVWRVASEGLVTGG